MSMADSDSEPQQCSNPDCRVAETGECVEGLEIEACPNFGGQEAVSTADEQPPLDLVSLSDGHTLDLGSTSRVLRAGPSRVVAIVGATASGKTSLIAGLYDLFQQGPVADLKFAGSLSLRAFELACHDARAASRRVTSHMNRTPLGEVRFYHLELGVNSENRTALVLADRAGEDYRAACDDVSLAGSFAEIRRADTLTVLVDGEKLLDSGARHNLRSDVILMLQSLKDGAAIKQETNLAVVLTKSDLIRDANAERAARDFAAIYADIVRMFDGDFTEVRQFTVAAYSMSESVPRGEGVADLLRFWMQAPRLSQPAVAIVPLPNRAFSRLADLLE